MSENTENVQEDAKAKAAREKAEKKAAEKAERERIKAEKAAQRAKEKADAKAVAEDKKRLEREAKEQAKKDKLAAKEAAKMPEQNGIRRPKPDTLCGKCWAVFDQVTADRGTFASIGESMDILKSDPHNQNEANVRAEYARWRKFNGVTGIIADPRKPVAPVQASTQAPETPTA